MEYEPKDIIVLGAIRNGAKNFGKIQKITKISPDELKSILEKLEQRGFIEEIEKKRWFSKKMELRVTEKGINEIENRIQDMEQKWNQMTQLYKSGNKQQLQDYMDSNRSFFPMMMMFGIMDMMMFSMMFSMMGAHMHDYVPADQIPAGTDTGTMDTGGEGSVGDADSGMGDGGFDIDVGF